LPRLVDERDSEIHVASQNIIQKVNTEINNFWEELASSQLTDRVLPNQAFPVTEVNVENNSQWT
jgi:hypothetical protein